MKVSRFARVECMIRSIPPFIPMPNWPVGPRNWVIWSERDANARAATIRRRAVPMPSGRSFRRFLGSL